MIILDVFLVLGIIVHHRPQVLSANTEKIKSNYAAQSYIVNLKRVASITPTPTITPSPTPSPKSSPTSVPSTNTQAANPPTPTTTQTSLGSGNLLDQVNAFRASFGLPPAQNDSLTCAFAATRAQEISTSFSHDGFNNRVSSHTLPYPSYHYVNENIAMNSDVNNVVQSWIDSPGHNENMRQDTPFVCIVNFGNFYAYEGYKP